MMNRELFSRYRSQRVEGLAIHCIQELCRRIGYEEVSADEARNFVRSTDLKDAFSKIVKNSSVRHRSRFGEIDPEIQRKLNLKLAQYDIEGRSDKEKRLLINEIVEESERFLKKKRELGLDNDLIVDLVADFESYAAKFLVFVRKVDRLYTLRRSLLRRSILDDQDFSEAEEKLAQIFQKHISRATSLL